MESEIAPNSELVLKNKDISNIISLAFLETKSTKNIILKSDLSTAISN